MSAQSDSLPLLTSRHDTRISWPLAAVFIVGESAGCGMLAIPYAVESTGYAGFSLLVTFCLLCIITGIVLGKCWEILQERFEDYRYKPTRDPFASIGFRAYGNPGRTKASSTKYPRGYAVSIANDIALFGGSTVLIILASQLLQSLLRNLGVDVSFCLWILVVAGLLVPISWLGTPKDMWLVAIIATCATAISAIIIALNTWLMRSKFPTVSHGALETQPFLMAFGTIAYTYAGHSVFPTIQHDMKEPKKFYRSVILAFSIMLTMYLPVAVTGFLVLGDNISDNILLDIRKYDPGPMVYTVQILIFIHLIFAFAIVTNPLFQEIEEFLKSPFKFHWKRVAIRTFMIFSIVFVAESIPRFGVIVSLLGGSIFSLLALVYPPLFYMRLKSLYEYESPERKLSFPSRLVLVLIMVIGVLCGSAATYSAIATIVAPNTFVLPCFINMNISIS